MIKFIKRLFLGILSLILIFVLAVVLFLNFAPAFGDEASGESLARIQESKHYNGEHFVNLVPTKVDTSDPNKDVSYIKLIFDFFNPAVGKNPDKPLPSESFNGNKFENGSFVWMGHSTVLMRFNNTNILTDPVFYNASPIPGTAESFDFENPIVISDLPEIDVVIISHDHYDHLDYQSVQELNDKVGVFYVPLGIKAHLLKWGVDDSKISEMEWYESTSFNGISFTMTPSRHFSGRGLTNRFSTLWCSWVIQSPADSTSIFFSGDSGYFNEFKKIGDQYGPFDLAFMENGAYDQDWNQIHFMPGENVQAAIDLQAKNMFPIHWGKYDLARHKWDTPIIAADSITNKRGLPLVTPLVGEIFDLQSLPSNKWWLELR